LGGGRECREGTAMVMKQISFEDAKKLATKKGLRPGQVKGTKGVQFTRGRNRQLQVIDWKDFEKILKARKLAIYESGGWMKIMKK